MAERQQHSQPRWPELQRHDPKGVRSMSRRILFMFEHPACNVIVDIHLPLPDPIEESTEAMAERVRPACPICKQSMRYGGWNFSDADLDESPSENPQHLPRISLDHPRIVGCTCGWHPPPKTENSDDAFATHVAIASAGSPL